MILWALILLLAVCGSCSPSAPATEVPATEVAAKTEEVQEADVTEEVATSTSLPTEELAATETPAPTPVPEAPAAPPAPPNPNPPDEVVKLIFIHHSTGGNWLAAPNQDQPYGDLGRTLMENNYFVSATNYGWGPDGIGDRTDIVNWPEWFTGPNRDTIVQAVYEESGQNIGDFGAWPRLDQDSGGENVIVMFKSCFPNSDLYGNPDDPPADAINDQYTVANAKAVYNQLLTYFATRQDKLFVVITAPPLMASETAPDRAANARAFNNWLVYDWLRDYAYPNVAVFDYYNVLTAPDNHHRWTGSDIEHVQTVDTDLSAYPSGDSHPSTAGHQKATAEFVPMLNIYYHRWQAGEPVSPPAAEPPPPEAEATSEAEATPDVEATPEDQEAAPSPVAEGIVEDFERGGEWHASSESGSTIACEFDTEASHTGATSLRVQYAIASGGWGDCGHHFDAIQNWERGAGLTLWFRVDAEGGVPEWVTLMLFSGDPEGPTPFEVGFDITDAQGAWTAFTFSWDDFALASWADDTGLDAIDPTRITGYGFSLGPGEGAFWLDDMTLSE
jgi:hypothetical protein